MNTREKILDKSLDLFSEDGYSDVSLEKIACAVGIKAPSIYKHFKSKKDIYDSLLATAICKVDQRLEGIDKYVVSKGKSNRLDLPRLSIDIFEYLLHDDYVSRIRKMISIEMYKNPHAMQFYVEKFIENPIAKHEEFIRNLGIKEDYDVKVLATIFYSPILLAVKLYDADPTKEDELVDLLNKSYKMLENIRK